MIQLEEFLKAQIIELDIKLLKTFMRFKVFIRHGLAFGYYCSLSYCTILIIEKPEQVICFPLS